MMMATPMALGNLGYPQVPMMGMSGNPGHLVTPQLSGIVLDQWQTGAQLGPADAFQNWYGAGAATPQPACGKDVPERNPRSSGPSRGAAGSRRSSMSATASRGSDSDAEREESGSTTLMIQNVPPKVTRVDVQKELAACGFAHLYDFCHVPRSLRSGEAQGFAFVNFVTPEAAAEFTKLWQGSRRLGSAAPYKPLRVTLAAVQGFQANAAVAVSKKAYRIRNAKFRPHFGQ